MDKIKTEGLCFRDELGRTRIFNGMNIDDKLLNQSEFRYTLDDEFFSKYSARGFNLIRLAITWANVEPEMGRYNESYLESIDKIFDCAEKYGVYILLDMHQDLYSGFDGVGGGDGAPKWACLTDGYEVKDYKFVWIEGYIFGKGIQHCFDHFWNNDEVDGRGLQDRFADMWQMLAGRYGEREGLFGFDLFNEPFPGTDSKAMTKKLIKSALREIAINKKINRKAIAKSLVHKDIPTLLDSVGGDIVRDIMEDIDRTSAYFDRDKYSPFLNKITSAIREITPNGIIMLEQSFYCNGGVGQFVPPITVDGRRESLQCFGPHSYDMTVDTPLYKYANADRVKAFFGEMRKTQKRLNVPVVVGEWGGCSDNTDTSWFPHAYELLDFFDEMQWGQLYWDYHGDDLDKPLMQMLSRTYPVAVNGDIIGYSNDRDNGIFTLEYTSDNQGETIVYCHTACKVESDGKVKAVKEFENGARLIAVSDNKGRHKLKLRYKLGFVVV